MIEKLNMKLLIIIVLFLLFVYLKTNSQCALIENMTSLNDKETVRKMDDYYTLKSDEKQKILELNCDINEKKYKFGFLNKSKFNSNCDLCGKTNLTDLMPVLLDVNKTSKKNCANDELIKCYNGNDIIDCKSHVISACNTTKISSSNLELILYNIQQKSIDKDGTIIEPSYILKMGNNKSNVLSLSPSSLEVKNKSTNVIEKKIIYFICCNNILNEATDSEKVYLEQYVDKKDKIRFKMYFKVPESENGELKKKYLGFSNVDLCDNIVCKDAKCKNDIKFLTLYSETTNKNILIFEPEIVRFD
jgi:hypothetical protein